MLNSVNKHCSAVTNCKCCNVSVMDTMHRFNIIVFLISLQKNIYKYINTTSHHLICCEHFTPKNTGGEAGLPPLSCLFLQSSTGPWICEEIKYQHPLLCPCVSIKMIFKWNTVVNVAVFVSFDWREPIKKDSATSANHIFHWIVFPFRSVMIITERHKLRVSFWTWVIHF